MSKSEEVQKKLLTSNEHNIGKTKFKLSDAIGIQNFAEQKLISDLRNVSFHKVSTVKDLYQAALDIQLFPDESAELSIVHAVNIRHDCVHRNGVQASTGELHEIDSEKIKSLVSLVQALVERIDDKIEAQTAFENIDDNEKM